MPVQHSRWWGAVTASAIAFWIVFVLVLMVADVWDETNGMLLFSSTAMSLGEKLHFVLTQSLGFWRPLPTLLIATVLHFVTDFEVSWRLLRAINAAMILGALGLLVAALRQRNEEWSPVDTALFTIAFLFSGSALITAGWYANAFDASALLLLSAGLFALLRARTVVAGVLFGVAFFCKETAALVFPFLLMLVAARRITTRQAMITAVPAAILGGAYFGFRSQIVAFGGPGDVHGFIPAELWPTMVHLGESFWRQTMKGSGPGVAGFVWLAVSLAALRRPRVVGAAVAFLAATAVVYWGMFSVHQDGVLMHYLNFVGRLYLVPVALMLVLLALERRRMAVAVLLIPIVTGAYTTWRDHQRFQRVYKRLYRTAAHASAQPLVVHYPMKPLDDTVRGIRVGDFPNAPVRVEARTGALEFR